MEKLVKYNDVKKTVCFPILSGFSILHDLLTYIGVAKRQCFKTLPDKLIANSEEAPVNVQSLPDVPSYVQLDGIVLAEHSGEEIVAPATVGETNVSSQHIG